MTDPRRLLADGGTDAERALLASARFDGPPEGAAEHTLLALRGLLAGGEAGSPAAGHGSGVASGGGAGPAASCGSASTSALWAKIGFVSLLGLGGVGAGILVHRVASAPARPVATSVAPASKPVASPVPDAAPTAGTAPTSLPANLPAPAAASASASPPGGTGLPERGEKAPDLSLGAETRLLEGARAAVDARDPAAARRLLDDYDHLFPQGWLAPEASVLRLAVLVQQGDRAAARSLAARLLANASYRAYDRRIRSLLRE